MIIIYTTFPDESSAEKISEELVKERLAACVSIFPVNSVYTWKDKLEKTKEVVLLIKTRKINFKRVEKFLLESHPYEIPCVIGFPARKTSKKYFRWVKNSVLTSKNK